jgi:hypothetical protein
VVIVQSVVWVVTPYGCMLIFQRRMLPPTLGLKYRVRSSGLDFILLPFPWFQLAILQHACVMEPVLHPTHFSSEDGDNILQSEVMSFLL